MIVFRHRDYSHFLCSRGSVGKSASEWHTVCMGFNPTSAWKIKWARGSVAMLVGRCRTDSWIWGVPSRAHCLHTSEGIPPWLWNPTTKRISKFYFLKKNFLYLRRSYVLSFIYTLQLITQIFRVVYPRQVKLTWICVE